MKITFDLEGDALKPCFNNQVFPNGNHYDPDTRLWCATFYNGKQTLTYVCKLPEQTRKLPRPYRLNNGDICWYTRSYHLKTTKVPTSLNNHRIIEIEDYGRFIHTIAETLDKLHNLGHDICFKAYGSYWYDRDVLRDNFAKFGIHCNAKIRGVNPSNWQDNHTRSRTAVNKDNQTFMNDAIIQNIEDTVKLFELID